MTPAKGQPSLGEAVDAYLATLERPRTRQTYADALIPMRDHFGAGTPLAGVDSGDVGDWLTQRWGRSASATRNIRLRAVRMASAFWIERGWITGSLAGQMKYARKRAELPVEILTPAEVQAMMGTLSLRAPTGIRNKALIMMFYRSGLRISEALSIRPASIDHSARSMRVLDTKSGEAQTRYYHESAEDSLNLWLAVRRERGINGHHPVFCTLDGNPLDDDYVRVMLNKAKRKAGVEKRVFPHLFRHTFAKELQDQGVPIEVISRLFGHQSVATTASYLQSLTNHQAGLALAQIDMPDVGEGSEGSEPGIDAELADLRKRLAQLETARKRTRKTEDT